MRNDCGRMTGVRVAMAMVVVVMVVVTDALGLGCAWVERAVESGR